MKSTSPRIITALLLTVFAGCATVGDRGQPIIPTQHTTKTGPYLVYTNYPLPADDGVVKQLVSLRTEIEDTLGVRVEAGDHPIEVYILADRKTYEHFLTFYYPELPQRRAFFIAQGDRRVVYTFKGERLEEDIRHEATHALLNLALGEIPLWLDEGLAEYFEVTSPTGLNREHLARLPRDAEEGWAPNLPRLEGLKTVRQMTPRDYREAWAWVHYLLNESGSGRAAILGFIGDFRNAKDVKPLSQRLSSSADEVASLSAHLDRLRNANPAKVATTEPMLRLQDDPIAIEPIEPAPKKPGFFGRLFGRMIP